MRSFQSLKGLPEPVTTPENLAMSHRRLPVYILLDCSESMIGESIEAVQRSVDMLVRRLRSDPHALETAQVSIISYHATAQQLVPLTDVCEFQIPQLVVRPGTSLGAAFQMLRECIDREVRKTTVDQKGDYRPIVFLMTDGQPTDSLQAVCDSIDRLTHPRIANLYAIGCGEEVDYDVLHKVSDIVFKLSDMTAETIGKLFVWLTASIQGASAGAGAAAESVTGIDLSKKPVEVEEVRPGSHPRYSGMPRQVFLKARCTKVGRPYLMRFRLDDELQAYLPVTSHPLDASTESGPGFNLPPINVSDLMGCAPCPYCRNPTAGVCECDALLCLPAEPSSSVKCPACSKQITLTRGGGEFTINQSAG